MPINLRIERLEEAARLAKKVFNIAADMLAALVLIEVLLPYTTLATLYSDIMRVASRYGCGALYAIVEHDLRFTSLIAVLVVSVVLLVPLLFRLALREASFMGILAAVGFAVLGYVATVMPYSTIGLYSNATIVEGLVSTCKYGSVASIISEVNASATRVLDMMQGYRWLLAIATSANLTLLIAIVTSAAIVFLGRTAEREMQAQRS